MTDWNQRYEVGETPWDKGAAAPPLQEIMERPEAVEWFGRGPVVVPGCGTGHDVRWLAQRLGAEVPVWGIDLAPLALERAQAFDRLPNVSYFCADWFGWRPKIEGPVSEQPRRRPSSIFEHTCFCAIHPSERERYIDQCARVLDQGGHLIGVFFIETGIEEGPPWKSSVTELERRFARDFELAWSQVPQFSYPGREGAEQIMIWRRR